MVHVLPSILAADFARLGEQIGIVERAGATMVHLDVMDGHFVPNLTMGPPLVESLRKITRMTFDVHLMIEDPDRYAPIFIQAGANQVLVHQEAATHLDRTLHMNPGFGGQAFIPNSLEKVRQLAARRKARGLQFQIEIDGGVTMENIASVVDAGVDWVVAGSSIFHTVNPAAAFEEMQRVGRNARAKVEAQPVSVRG